MLRAGVNHKTLKISSFCDVTVVAHFTIARMNWYAITEYDLQKMMDLIEIASD